MILLLIQVLVLVTFKHYRIQLGAHQRLTSWSTCNASGPKIQIVFFYIFQDSLISYFQHQHQHQQQHQQVLSRPLQVPYSVKSQQHE